jgi:hypothetical protein
VKPIMYTYPRIGAPQSTFDPSQQPDWLPHRDQNGILFMWSDSVEGPPPAQAPPDRIIDANGNFVATQPQQAGTLPSGQAIPPLGPIAQTPASAYWAESVPRPRSSIFTSYTPPPQGSPSPGGVIDDAKTAARNKALKEVGLLAALTAPAWGTILVELLFGL